MDPYELAQRQGQVIGGTADADQEPVTGTDLMDLLRNAFLATGRWEGMCQEDQDAIDRFTKFAGEYLAATPVISTGVVDGAFSLVFEGAVAVPLSPAGPAPPQRPDSTVPITIPRELKMRGLPVRDNSVPMTTGNIGVSPRKPR
jgi:hypothetical protein